MPGYPFDILTGSSGSDYVAPAGSIIAGASNVKRGVNPAFAATNFLGIYPQFKNTTIPAPAAGTGWDYGLNVPDAFFDMLLDEANGKVLQVRWHGQWLRGMCNYIAHYATLYLAATTGKTPQGLLQAAAPKLIQTSKSVGDVSSGYDASSIMEDLNGYGDLKSTTYGVQLATAARFIGKGGMGIW